MLQLTEPIQFSLFLAGLVKQSVYDDCWNRVVEELKKVVPVAINLKVRIALENVWNNFLISRWRQRRLSTSLKLLLSGHILTVEMYLFMGGQNNGLKYLVKDWQRFI